MQYCQVVDTNTQLEAKLQAALAAVETLEKKYANLATIGRAPSTGKNDEKKPTSGAGRMYKSYCWTHGFRAGKGHNSENCHTPAERHQNTATMHDTMGGNKEFFNPKQLPPQDK